MDIKELNQLLKLPNNKFEGHLILKGHDIIWTLHFVQGRLIYAADGLHGVRRWNYTINQNFPKFKLNIAAAQLSTHQYWQLYLLDQGFKEQQLSLVRAKLLLRAVIQECLFELSQCTYVTSEWQPAELPVSRLCCTIALSPWEIDIILNKVNDMQQAWQHLGMTGTSPQLSPTLKNPVNHQHLPISHQYLTGTYTLWQIATNLAQPIEEVAKPLIPLIQDQSLELKKLPDLPLANVQLSPMSLSRVPDNATAVSMPQQSSVIRSSPISAKPYELVP
ncbi:hypothetical protein [Leptothoe sp. PORK10 BA2]|uniref:hypothetical protein n=1 Tax=Leptothoe sp. PORK10 BA2 TaxID=3110254 RepID=UPI002B21DE74|nr:hypothetical protein [Leptothoe sp. PORK10 BA2]MEA5464989.1 hypothetical protein [Leptothoe sp. PORK10 BA2]